MDSGGETCIISRLTGGGASILKAPQGFTLAEVLITLGIIGIVAALTMPTLIAKYQEKVASTQLKKVYSMLSQAFSLALEENGDPTGWGLTYFTAAGSENFMNIFVPYLKTLKVCGTAAGCWYDEPWQTLDGTLNTAAGINAADARLQLADGALLQFTSRSANCTYSGDVCGHFHVDINGQKPPNQIGRDVFFFYLKKDKILPFGFSGDAAYPFPDRCSTTLKGDINNGGACAAWVIYNENMDYLHCDDLSWNGKTKCD